MKYLIKHNLIILAIFIIFTSQAVAGDTILPKPKPTVSKEIKVKTAEKKNLYPQKKPLKKKEKKEAEENLQIAENIEEEKEIFIYPAKKPIIVKQKITTAVKKSSILSKRDFEIAKKAFDFVDKRKW